MEWHLSEVVDIVTVGQIISRVVPKDKKTMEKGTREIRTLMPSAISGGMIHHENLRKGQIDPERVIPERRITKVGDIVIKLSSPYDCALITVGDQGLVVPSFCAIIRGIHSDRVDPYYLLGYLNSDYARRYLLAGVVGSSMAMVRARALESLPIPDLSKEKQRILGKVYWESCRRKAIFEKLAKKQQELSDSVISEALSEVKNYD